MQTPSSVSFYFRLSALQLSQRSTSLPKLHQTITMDQQQQQQQEVVFEAFGELPPALYLSDNDLPSALSPYGKNNTKTGSTTRQRQTFTDFDSDLPPALYINDEDLPKAL